MTNHELTHNQETETSQAKVAFEMIASLEERNSAFTAFEQIKGAQLAGLFLEGYADAIETESPDDIRQGETALDVAYNNIKYIAGYYISGDDDGNERLKASLTPWNEAYDALSPSK